MMTDLAIILAVYHGDHPQHLSEALQSIFGQDYTQFTLLIVCDGPIPDTLEQVLPAGSDQVVILRQEENRGLAEALNLGIRYCLDHEFSYIARMDADDRMKSSRLRLQVQWMNEHPGTDVLGTAIEEIDGQGRPRGKTIVYPADHDACRKFFRYRDPVAHPSVLFRDRFFHKAGLYEPQLRKNQDTWLWYKGFMSGCRFANLEEALLEFRMSDDFFRSRRGGWKRARQLLGLRKEINAGMAFPATATIYSLLQFILGILPAWGRRLAYRILR